MCAVADTLKCWEERVALVQIALLVPKKFSAHVETLLSAYGPLLHSIRISLSQQPGTRVPAAKAHAQGCAAGDLTPKSHGQVWLAWEVVRLYFTKQINKVITVGVVKENQQTFWQKDTLQLKTESRLSPKLFSSGANTPILQSHCKRMVTYLNATCDCARILTRLHCPNLFDDFDVPQCSGASLRGPIAMAETLQRHTHLGQLIVAKSSPLFAEPLAQLRVIPVGHPACSAKNPKSNSNVFSILRVRSHNGPCGARLTYLRVEDVNCEPQRQLHRRARRKKSFTTN
eukprot:3376645-Pyramimonas_sp.AAC.1